MKLSPDMVEELDMPAPVLAWAPQDFCAKRSVDQNLVDQIKSVFTKEIDETVQAGESGRAGKLIHPQAGSLRWKPAELSQVILQPVQPLINMPSSDAASGPVEPYDLPLLIKQNEADEILRQAHEQAEAMVQQAQSKASEITTQAYQEGMDQGKADAEELTIAAKAILEQVSEWRVEMLAQSEGLILDMVHEISMALFSEGFILDENVLQATLSRVMANSRTLGDLRIYLNPEDASQLDSSWKEYQVSISNQKIQIVGSEAIQPGGCFIDGQNGTVDARIDTRLKLILDAISREGAVS